MKYHLDWLIEQYEKGEKLKFLFFWGHQPRKDGSVGDGCFSQWWPAAFVAGDASYPTAEHWMMAQKARLFGDGQALAKIVQAKTPAEAKKLGRSVENFDFKQWDEHKYGFVKAGNAHKFGQHPDLKAFLLVTNSRILVEASPVDSIWGIGLAKTHENIENPHSWKGQNLLGFALMEVRDELSIG